MKKLTQENIKSIPSLKEQGHDNDSIARMFNVSTTSIQKWCQRLRKAGHKVKEDKKGAKAFIL